MTELLTQEQLAEFRAEDLTLDRLHELKERVLSEAPQRRIIANYVAQLVQKAPKLRNSVRVQEAYFVLGALQWVLARFEDAAESLGKVKRNDIARELEAESRLQAGDYKRALKLCEKLAEKTPNVKFDVARVECLRGLGRLDEAENLLKALHDKYDGEAEYHHQLGLGRDLDNDWAAAVEEYTKALELDEDHVETLFRMGYLADLRGDEDKALEYYERCARSKPLHVNALINLGVLYEDMGRHEEAEACFERVLRWRPTHARARLFLRDARASMTMYIDEEQERRVDRRNKVLEVPVTDFELSVRSRNCLERMNIKTLGDLTQVTEQELLAYKNFGETSLSEIKTMMASRGLRLGQALEKEQRPADEAAGLPPLPVSGDDISRRPIGELELSVRSRRCMQRLGIVTIGELCDRTVAELMGCDNFGQTSINEVKQKLANLGLKLKDQR